MSVIGGRTTVYFKTTFDVCIRNGNEIPNENGNGNPMVISWDWDKHYASRKKLGGNGKQHVWEWEESPFPWQLIPIHDYGTVLQSCTIYQSTTVPKIRGVRGVMGVRGVRGVSGVSRVSGVSAR